MLILYMPNCHPTSTTVMHYSHNLLNSPFCTSSFAHLQHIFIGTNQHWLPWWFCFPTSKQSWTFFHSLTRLVHVRKRCYSLLILFERQLKNLTSCIWGYYGFYPDAKGEPKHITQPICRLCKRCVKASEGLFWKLDVLGATISQHHVLFNIIIFQILSIPLTTLIEHRAKFWWADI